jgi:hypothetical protein
MKAMVCVVWLILTAGSSGAIAATQAADLPLLNQALLIEVTETPLEIDQAPIGVHLELQIQMPNEWLEKYNPNCAKLIKGSRGFRAGFGDARLPVAFGIDLIAFSHTTCVASSIEGLTTIQFSGDFYPPAVLCDVPRYPCPAGASFAENPAKICIQPYSLDRREHGFDVEFPNDPNPAAFKTQIIERMRLLRDNEFWRAAEQNLKPKHLHASGYTECAADRAYANDPHICYCASAESLSQHR